MTVKISLRCLLFSAIAILLCMPRGAASLFRAPEGHAESELGAARPKSFL
jgi:hypothetical protein